MYKLVLLLLMMCSVSVFADTIVLKNGDRLTGTLNSISGGKALIETDYAGPVAISLDAIERLESDAALDVDLESGRISGKFTYQDDSQKLVGDSGSREVDITQVRRAGKNRLALTSFGSSWDTRADLSAIISNGNSKTESYNTLVESTLKRDAVEHALSLLISSEEAEEVTTKDQLDLDYGYKRFVSEKWYASGNAEYFKDELKDIDQRITLGAGMGYQFWDDSFGAFSSELGVSAVKEELDGEDETNPAVRWGLDYRRNLFSQRMEVFHKQSILFIPDSDRGEVLESSTGVRYALNSRIDATARVDLNHETDPPEGSSKSDVTYTLGVGIKF